MSRENRARAHNLARRAQRYVNELAFLANESRLGRQSDEADARMRALVQAITLTVAKIPRNLWTSAAGGGE